MKRITDNNYRLFKIGMFPRFTSTTKNRDVAWWFAEDYGKNKNPVYFKIYVTKNN